MAPLAVWSWPAAALSLVNATLKPTRSTYASSVTRKHIANTVVCRAPNAGNPLFLPLLSISRVPLRSPIESAPVRRRAFIVVHRNLTVYGMGSLSLPLVLRHSLCYTVCTLEEKILLPTMRCCAALKPTEDAPTAQFPP
jgi:hypothetical protein